MKRLKRILSLILMIGLLSPIGLNANHRKFITVAVIDSGLDKTLFKKNYETGICRMGHRDFTGLSFDDSVGHGTNISGLIHRYAKGKRYCQVIIKFYDEDGLNLESLAKALQYAINIKVDIINISAGGYGFDEKELKTVKNALDSGIIVVAAAGNNSADLKEKPYYPASYDERIIVVGSKDRYGNRLKSSNYGTPVDIFEEGLDMVGEYGKKLSGTSQATAVVTGKIIKGLIR